MFRAYVFLACLLCATACEARAAGVTQPVEGEAPVNGQIRFGFAEAPFAQVLDFFSRETGLPVIREADVPGGAMSFVSERVYSLNEALEILNLNLARHGVRVVREQSFLYLRSLADAARKPTEVASPADLDGVAPTEYVTVTIELNNSAASRVAEQVRTLIKEPGSVQAVDAQNLIILVETAAQARRISELVARIDSQRPVDSEYKVFTLEHADADAVVETLKGLVGQRVVREIIEKDGKVRTVEQFDVAGLNLQPDPRTGSVIAIGSASRLRTVEELIGVLDRPATASGGAANTLTYQLSTVTPRDAAARIQSLFGGLRPAERPRVVSLDAAGKVMVLGSAAQLQQASALLGELDPASNTGVARDGERVARSVALEHISGQQAEAILRRLLTPVQNQMVRSAPGPDGRTLVVAGPARDVDAFLRLLASIDVPADIRREVRTLALAGDDAESLIARTRELESLDDGAREDPVDSRYDAEGGSLTMIGSRAALDRFERRLDEVRLGSIGPIESRMYRLERATPSELAGRLSRLLPALLAPSDGSPFNAPVIEALDDLDSILVRADAEQFGVVEQMIDRLDAERPGERQLRVIDVAGDAPTALVERAMAIHNARADTAWGPVDTEFDGRSGKLIVSARAEAMASFDEALRQASQLLPPSRDTRIIDVRQADAAALLGPLREFLLTADPIDASRAVPDPEIRVIERTNSLLVTAEDAQHRLIQDYVRRLDRLEPGALPPLKLLQLRAADAVAIASMLNEQYARRPSADRTTRPVEVRADGATNTLIVSAHEELFDDIRGFVDELNRERTDGPERVTVLYTLKVARAQDVATAMDRLYAAPPVPLDRRGRPMPWMQEAKAVTVSADPSSNSLIIDAPADRIASLEELAARLDRVELPPVAELRTYPVVGADLGAVTQMLQGLARRGTLSGPAQAGKPPMDVVIEAEPVSGTLIVAGDDATFQRVEQVLASLTAVPEERGLRIVPIANAAANDIRERALEIYGAQVAQVPGAGAVEVSIDEASNSLEVVADEEAMQRFLGILEQLQDQVGPARELRLIELDLVRAGEVVDFLRELASASESLRAGGGPSPVFEPIETSNALLIAAQPEQFPIIEQLVRSVDRRHSAERPPLRILRLRSTDADNLARVLQRSYQQRAPEERMRRPVDIQADPATNTLIVSAHPEVMPELESIVSRLNDAPSLDAEDREIRIFPLKVARAEELARTIDQMYPQPPVPRDSRGRARPDLQPEREIVVRADRATNSLIVDAPVRRLAGFEQIVQSLDSQAMASDVEVRTYTLGRVDPQDAAQTVQRLAEAGALGGTGRVPITVTPAVAARSLVVSGPTEIFERVESLLDDLEGVERAGTSLKMYAVRHARADRLQPLLDRLLRARLAEDPAFEASAQAFEVASDRASNTLIVSAPEAVQDVAAALIASLDVPQAEAGRSIVRVVALEHADAGSVSGAVRSALGTLDLATPDLVAVTPAAGSDAIVITGPQGDVERVEALVRELDREPVDREALNVRVFELEHASAVELAPRLERVLGGGGQSIIDLVPEWQRFTVIRELVHQGRPVNEVSATVEPAPNRNALVVTGDAATLARAAELIESLDSAEAGERAAVVFTPRRLAPTQLVEAARALLEARLGTEVARVRLTPDDAAGSVVIGGPRERVGDAVRTLAELDDRAPERVVAGLRVFEIEHADASVVARSLGSMLGDRSRWPEPLRRAEAGGLGVPAPSVEASPGRIVVSAPESLLAMAGDLVDAFDQPAASGSVEVRVFSLARGDASSVADAVGEALGAMALPGEPPAVVRAEAGSNTVIVAASASRLGEAERLIGAMDSVAVEPGGVGVRTIFLKHARAEVVAPIVERVLEQEDVLSMVPDWGRWQVIRDLARSGQSVESNTVRVEAERRLNALVVSGPAPVLELAEQVVSGLDVPGGSDAGERELRVITLVNAEAAAVVGTLDAVFDEDGTGEPAPLVQVDVQSNSLIVRGTPAQIGVIANLADQLDRATLGASRELRTIPVDRSRADAQSMARTIQRLLGERGGVSVEVISTDELFADPDEGGFEGDAEAEVEDGASSERGTGQSWRMWAGPGFALRVDEPGDAERPAVRIAVDPETNSLVVEGSPRLTERIAELARELEEQMPADPGLVRLIELPDSADPQAIAGIVNQTVRQVGQASADNPGGFTGRVGIAADRLGGMLIVWANRTDFDSIRPLVAALARPGPAGETTVKVYPLRNVSADRARAAVVDLLRAAPVGAQARRIRGLDIGIAGDDGEVVRREIDPARVRVTVDPGQTSLIVAAPDAALELIDELVEILDQNPVRDRLAIKRYTLQNASSTELIRTLQQLFDAQRQGPGARDLPRARFVADARTNAILVTASKEQHEQAAGIIAAADEPVGDADAVLEVITLERVRPSAVASVVADVIIAGDPAKRDRVRLSAQDAAGVLVVRASEADAAEVRSIVERLDDSEASGFPIRTISLERADAGQVAASLKAFFGERSRINRGRGVREAGGDAAIIGDRRSGTLLIAASDDDYEQIASLAAQFDAPAEAREFRFRVIPLKNVRVSDIRNTVQAIAGELQWERSSWFRGGDGGGAEEDKLYVQVNERSNSVVVFGQGDIFDTIEEIIAELDRAPSDLADTVVRVIPAPGVDLQAVADTVESVTATPGWRSWYGPDPDAVRVRIDRERRLLILIGKRGVVEEAEGYVKEIVDGGEGDGDQLETVALANARAADVARALQAALPERVRVRITPVVRTNSLLLTGPADDLAFVRARVAELDDEPDSPPLEFSRFALEHADAADVAFTLNQLVRNRPRGNDEPAPSIDYLPQENMLAVTATAAEMAFIADMVGELDIEREGTRTTEFVKLRFASAEQTAEALRVFYGRFAPEARNAAERRVSIVPDPTSNSLVISADQGVWEGIRELLSTLDTEAYDTSQQLVVIPLRHASAVSVARALNEGFRAPLEDQLQRERVRLEAERRRNGSRDDFVSPPVLAASEGTPTVSAEPQTNSLIVFAGRKELARIEAIVASLDVPDYLELPSARVIPIESGRASEIAQSIQRVLTTEAERNGNPRRAVVIGDDTSRVLIVRAEDGEYMRALALAQELQARAGASEASARVLRVGGQSASSLRTLLLGSLGPAAQQRNEGLAIEVDRVSNALVITSSESIFEQARGIVEALGGNTAASVAPAGDGAGDETVGVGGATVRVVGLRRGSPAEMVDLLNRLGVSSPPRNDRVSLVGEAVTLATLPARRAIIVTGAAGDVAAVAALAERLDADLLDLSQSVEVLRLERADAQQLAQTIGDLLSPAGGGSTPEARAVAEQVRRLGAIAGIDAGIDLRVPVRVLADRASNTLLIASSPANAQAVRALAASLDVLPAGRDVTLRLFPLEHAAAPRVREILEELFRRGEALGRPRVGGQRGVSETMVGAALLGEVALSVDERTNTLLIAGPEESVALAEVLVRDLDAPDATQAVGLHVIPVPDGDAAELGPRLQRLILERIRAQRGSGPETARDVFRIEADPAAGVLIVVGSEDNARAVRELIESLRQGSGLAGRADETSLIALNSPGRAEEIAEAIEELYVRREVGRRGERAVSVVPNERLNALVVSGTPSDIEQIRELARQLDQAEIGIVEDVRRIQLESASAEDVVDLLESVLAGRSIGGNRLNGGATRVRVMSDALAQAATEATIDGAIRDQVTLTADPRTNSILVKAPPEILRLIETIVRDLDSETRGDRVIARFMLANSDAVQMQQLLVELFNLTRRGDRFVLTPSAGEGDGAAPDGRFTTAPGETRELIVTVDRRTNTLLASGTPELIDEVRGIVDSLDSVEGNDRERVVYHLRNALAPEIEETLQAYFGGESELRRTTLGPQLSGSLLRELEQEVTIVGDAQSNKLVISASPRYLDTVLTIVEELDASPPQVMIQVLLAEVTLNSNEEWGVDFAIGGLIGLSVSDGDGPIGNDDLRFNSRAGGAGVATSLGVPNLAVSTTDFNLLIRALQAQGRLEVLSRPQIQVNNNETAFINVGENIAITDGVERRDNVTTAIVRRENVGITLNVTPAISSDGFVRLDIAPEISSLSTRTTQIDADFEAPIITQRQVQTTVTVKDGETVVIGGLIQTTDGTTQTKVPLLGDIPGLGELFRSTREDRIKTELLVILTPFVIPGDDPTAMDRQRRLNERSLNSLYDRRGVERMLELGEEGPIDDDNSAVYREDW